jgi:hypothetical protein
MKRILGMLVLSVLGLSVRAQSKNHMELQVQDLKINSLLSNKVSGMILDEANRPLPSITVCLIELPAKTSFILARTNASGVFSFQNVPAGSYLVQSIQIGKQKKLSEPFTVEPMGETKIQPIIMAGMKSSTRTLDSLKAISKNL